MHTNIEPHLCHTSERNSAPFSKSCNDETADEPDQSSLQNAVNQALILIVDDDNNVREIVERLLRASGFQTLTASGGQEAIALLQMHSDAISAVMLDMLMPLMGGAETLREIDLIKPGIPVLLMSGWSEEKIIHELMRRPMTHFIPKPFGKNELKTALYRLLSIP